MRIAVLLLVVLSGCATSSPERSAALRDRPPRVPATEEERAALFIDRVATDPNGALCGSIIERLHGDDVEALTPFIDRKALVERALSEGTLSKAQEKSWRAHAEEIDNLSRYHYAKGTRFYCLGTVTFEDEPVLALRGRMPEGKWAYLLLRLGDNRERPIDDYRVLESGIWHSQLQTFFEDPRYAPFAESHSSMLKASFDGRYDEILATYAGLPPAVQRTPLMSMHFINAVMTVTAVGTERGDERFKEAAALVDEVFTDPVTRAYWHMIFQARLGETEAALRAVDMLTTALDDPLAPELRAWVHERAR